MTATAEGTGDAAPFCGIRLDSGKLASCKSVAGVPEMLECGTAVLMPAKLPCNRPALPLMSSTAFGMFFCGIKLDSVHREQQQGVLAAEPLLKMAHARLVSCSAGYRLSMHCEHSSPFLLHNVPPCTIVGPGSYKTSYIA